MQDRYLFKAKRLDNSEWVQGVPFEIEGKTVILINDNENLLRVHYLEENMWDAEICAIEVEVDTICQYTGLKDKNGNLIWENDVVSIPSDDELGVLDWNSDRGCWCMNTQDAMYTFDNFWSYEIEVIGNVFGTNPMCC